jgi:hypothetical protein
LQIHNSTKNLYFSNLIPCMVGEATILSNNISSQLFLGVSSLIPFCLGISSLIIPFLPDLWCLVALWSVFFYPLPPSSLFSHPLASWSLIPIHPQTQYCNHMVDTIWVYHCALSLCLVEVLFLQFNTNMSDNSDDDSDGEAIKEAKQVVFCFNLIYFFIF